MHRLTYAFMMAATLVCTGSAAAATTLSLHAEAPKASVFGKVFVAWSHVVAKQTAGAVQLDWQWNGKVGNEESAARLVSEGKLGGGYFSARGMGQYDRSIWALQVRGAFDTWEEYRSARSRLEPELFAAWAAKNAISGGWADLGIGRFMSRGFAVTDPASLRGKVPVVVEGDFMSQKLYAQIGGITPVTSTVDALLGKLQGPANVIVAPAYPAEQLLWASRMDHIYAQPLFFAAGGIILAKSQLDQLSPEQRELVLSTSRRAAQVLNEKLDAEGAQAYGRLKTRLTVHEASEAQQRAWADVFRRTCEALRSEIPPGALKKAGAC